MDKITLVDIGAAGGLHKRWKSVEEFLDIIGFEPDVRSTENFLPLGLYKESGILPFYETQTKTDSSILKPNYQFLNKFPKSDRFKTVKTSQIQVNTLDSFLTKKADFIKLDTQGSELHILQGAQKTLPNTLGVEIEVEFSPLYEGQPLFAEIDNLMRSFDFELFDLAPIYWKRKLGKGLGNSKGQIIYADALYFKNPKKIKGKMAFSKAIFLSLVYGYFDFALEIAETGEKFFTEEEYKKSIDYIYAHQPKNTFFPGKRKLASILRKMAHAMDRDPQIWQLASSVLGNSESIYK